MSLPVLLTWAPDPFKMQRITTILFVVLPWLPFILAKSNNNSTIDHRGCPTKCGSLTIEYPFGIGVGAGCSISPWYDINCSTAFNPPIPFLAGANNGEIINISNTTIRLKSNWIASRCYNEAGSLTGDFIAQYGVDEKSPYSFSNENMFVVVGCDDVSFMQRLDTGNLISCCTAICSQTGDLIDGSCSGIGCCESSIPKGVKNFQKFLNSNGNHSKVFPFNRCGYSFLGEKGSYRFRSSDIFDDDQRFEQRIVETVPMVLDWVIGNRTCNETRKLNQLACQENSVCDDFDTRLGGYHCECLDGYEGNPYLKPGCQDINECEKNPCHEKAICTNTPGSYNCSCQHGYDGDGKKFGLGCLAKHSNKGSVYIGLSTSIGLLLLLIVTYGLYKVSKKKRETNCKKKYFERNGGLLLQQQVSTNEGLVEKTRLFTVKELSKATDQFNESRILGRGGQGTVYKGMLSDGRTVAVKKSKLVGENQLQPFINEVIILSQLNHKNVVKLLGCCLETEVPLLVYEFISNRTLFDHIHDPNIDFPITWDMRLRIAVEIAGALAYLHYEISLPIYHRDIKTSNILLDENYRPRVSDFGTSRSIATDKTHLTTVVKGTFGYVDPEYFQSSQFTDKSDVYSFGVVLVELLSGQKPISSSETEDGRGLAGRFLHSIEQNFLHKILDPKILGQEKDGEIIAVAALARRCLNLSGKKRPTMKEVAMELENITLSNKPIETNSAQISMKMGSLALSDLDSTWMFSDGDSDVRLDTKPLIYRTV